MKRIAAFFTALILFFLCVCCMKVQWEKEIIQKQVELTYYNTDDRNSCKLALEYALKNHGIPVLGSSELTVSVDDIAYPPALFQNGNSDFNMVLIGKGYCQSLHHAITLGAISDVIPDRKVVLILSPQWFSAFHIAQEIFASKFLERSYVDFLKNPNISADLKSQVTEQVKSHLLRDEKELERVKKYERKYLGSYTDPLLEIEMGTYDSFMNVRQTYRLAREVKGLDYSGQEIVYAENIDFTALMERAQAEGEASCTNNEFGIKDDVFDENIRDKLESEKNLYADENYSESREYDDLKLFLEVCRETGIEPLIISIPIHGRYYDHLGFLEEDRLEYYQNIRDICDSYQVDLADFTDKEYELYFMRDTVHLGWKGWVYVDEAIYQFAKGNE